MGAAPSGLNPRSFLATPIEEKRQIANTENGPAVHSPSVAISSSVPTPTTSGGVSTPRRPLRRRIKINIAAARKGISSAESSKSARQREKRFNRKPFQAVPGAAHFCVATVRSDWTSLNADSKRRLKLSFLMGALFRNS